MMIAVVAMVESLVTITIQMMTRDKNMGRRATVLDTAAAKNMVEMITILERIGMIRTTTTASIGNTTKATIAMMTRTEVMVDQIMVKRVTFSLAMDSRPLVMPRVMWDLVILSVLSA